MVNSMAPGLRFSFAMKAPRNIPPKKTKVKTLQTLEATPNFAALFRSGELGSGMEVSSFGSGLGGFAEKASGF